MEKVRKRVCVGLSGGVDSSVAAKRLLSEGFEVIGVFIKTWQPDFINCTWEAERLDAMRVAAQLNIPFYTCDAELSYKEKVADYMINEYKAGRVPNPDVMCNKFIKFGTFIEFAHSLDASIVATGHYAQINKSDGIYTLHRGFDPQKDQSYFLWTLTQEQLSQVLFPVGDSLKKDIRHEAKKSNLLTSSKPDSQGVCFLGNIDMREFLSEYIKLMKGDVIDESGTVIGTHEGALFYTIGQRHGFKTYNSEKLSSPYFVTKKDIQKNTLTVSHTIKKVLTKKILLEDVNCIGINLPNTCEAQFRYRQRPFNVKIENLLGDRVMLRVIDGEIEAPSIGQSCVFFNSSQCLGGGIVTESYENN